MAAEERGGVGYVITSSAGDLGRAIYDMQRRIASVEEMNSNQFTDGVIRVSSFIPSVGIVSFT
jgi:hypothetical protein